uniref:Uncharacterized protein n=1 Tax=Oryza brachyantha TaxID=4533 RepID=J3LT53_ORYBR
MMNLVHEPNPESFKRHHYLTTNTKFSQGAVYGILATCFSRFHDLGEVYTNQDISPFFLVALYKRTPALGPPVLHQALPAFSAIHQAQGKALVSQLDSESSMILSYEISQPSSFVDLNGTLDLPLNPSPSLQFPLWVAPPVTNGDKPVNSMTSMAAFFCTRLFVGALTASFPNYSAVHLFQKIRGFNLNTANGTYLKFIEFKVSIPTATAFIAFKCCAIICIQIRETIVRT